MTTETTNATVLAIRLPAGEPPTSGIENIIDWDQIEEKLAAHDYPSKMALKKECREMFAEAGEDLTHARWQEVKAGLFPEHRAKLLALPDQGLLTPKQQAEARQLIRKGETKEAVARLLGVHSRTIFNLLKGATA